MKILLENLLRFEDGRSVTKEDIAGGRRLAGEQGQGRAAKSPFVRRAS